MTKKTAVRSVLLAVVGTACAAAVLVPIYSETDRGTWGKSQCLSNTKQSTLAVIMYSGDFDDRYPLLNWMDVTPELREER